MAYGYQRHDSAYRMKKRHASVDGASWHGTAFLIESMLLLVCLVTCTAVIMHIFSLVYAQGHADRDLVTATRLASNVAETFAADPTAVTTTETTTEDGYVVSTKITTTATDAGTMYHAFITVSSDDAVVYELETDRFAKGAS